MQAAYGAILFCEMFHDDPKLFVKSTSEFYGHILTDMANLL